MIIITTISVTIIINVVTVISHDFGYFLSNCTSGALNVVADSYHCFFFFLLPLR